MTRTPHRDQLYAFKSSIIAWTSTRQNFSQQLKKHLNILSKTSRARELKNAASHNPSKNNNVMIKKFHKLPNMEEPEETSKCAIQPNQN